MRFTITAQQADFRCAASARWRLLCAFLLVWLPAAQAFAAPLSLNGHWYGVYEVPPTTAFEAAAWPDTAGLRRIDHIPPTGGGVVYEAEFRIERAGTYVLDFKNSSVVAHFRHRIVDARGALVAELSGGISSTETNPFFLRHGREVTLAPGQYRLSSWLDSPFYLAQPEPYLDALADYREAINPGNALVLACVGIFLALGIYYAVLASVRRRLAEGMYAVFILGNLLYNTSALLVLHDLFGLTVFYLISVPILFSNIAYVVFAVSLLGLRRGNAPVLYHASRVLIGLMGGFAVVAALRPHWSLELDRIGVALFLVFGLCAGVRGAWRGERLARWYLVANLCFFVTGLTSISLIDVQGSYTWYVEHLGLIAVVIEVLALALVLAYQFGQLQHDKELALARAEHNLRIACTDALTGRPNRYALELELAELTGRGSLTLVDLDGLKRYNDRFGHARGDQLLCDFSAALAQRLGSQATLHRMGGDEFAITSRSGDIAFVERMLEEAIESMRRDGYQLLGASSGSARMAEDASRDQLKHIADTRMYENKRNRRRLRDQVVPIDAEPAPMRLETEETTNPQRRTM